MTEPKTPLPGTMPGRTPEGAPQPADFAPLDVARGLLRAGRSGTLATLDRNTGHPFASLVNVATDRDGAPVILVSGLATHTANQEVDGRASLLIAAPGKGDALAHPRLTVLGRFRRIAREHPDDVRLRGRFLLRHPKSELYAGFPDFSFWRMDVAAAHLNGGFARAADLTAADLISSYDDASELAEIEEGAIAHMNGDHAEACRLYATKLLKEPDGAWRCVGISPEGSELQAGGAAACLPFPARVSGAGALRAVLKQLADKARAV